MYVGSVREKVLGRRAKPVLFDTYNEKNKKRKRQMLIPKIVEYIDTSR